MARPTRNDREAVLAAAADLADTTDPGALTLAALAEQLGVRTPSLYHYIAGLAGLHRDLALHSTRALTAVLAGAAVGRAGDEAVLAMANAYRAYIKAHPGVYAAAVTPAAPEDTELAAAQAELVSLVARGLAGYRLAGDDAIHAVRALRALVHGFATLEAAGGFGLPLDLDESFARLIEAYLAGLHALRGVNRSG